MRIFFSRYSFIKLRALIDPLSLNRANWQDWTSHWKFTPDIRISRISAGYQRSIKRISRENWPISIKYQTDFSRISKICYLDIRSDTSGLWSKSSKLKKSLKTALFRCNPTAGYQGYQPDISWISMPFVHRISWAVTPRSLIYLKSIQTERSLFCLPTQNRYRTT